MGKKLAEGVGAAGAVGRAGVNEFDTSPTLGRIENAVSNLGYVEIPDATAPGGKRRVEAYDVPAATKLAIGLGVLPAALPAMAGETAAETALNLAETGGKLYVGSKMADTFDNAIEQAYPGARTRHARFLKWLADQGVQTLPFMMTPATTGMLHVRGRLTDAMEDLKGETTPAEAEAKTVPPPSFPKLTEPPATEPVFEGLKPASAAAVVPEAPVTPPPPPAEATAAPVQSAPSEEAAPAPETAPERPAEPSAVSTPTPEPAKPAEGESAPSAPIRERLEKLPEAPLGGIAETPRGQALARLENAPHAPIRLVPTELFEEDPARFQFKLESDPTTGVSGTFDKDTRFDPELVGVGTAYYDPETDKLHPVNMHNRLALARKDKFPYLPVKVLDGGNALSWAASHNVSAADARAHGALQNIAEGRGSSLDAAQYLRDSNATVEQMRQIGLNLSDRLVREAKALQNLDDGLWQLTKLKVVEPSQAAIIGEEIPTDHAAQRGAFNWLRQKVEAGKPPTQDVLRKIAQQYQEAGSTLEDSGRPGDQRSLLGEDFSRRSMFEEQAAILSGVEHRLSQERAGFSSAARNAERLEAAGNTIVAERNRTLAQQAADRLAILDTWLKRPELKAIVRDAARQLQDNPRRRASIINDAYEALTKAADEAAALAPKDAPPPQVSLFGQGPDGALFKDDKTGKVLTSAETAAKTREPGFSLSGGYPGGEQLAQILEPEMRYHMQQMARRGRAVLRYVRMLFAPQTLSADAKRAAQIYIETASQRAARTVSDEVALRPLRDIAESKLGPERNWRAAYEWFAVPFERGEMPSDIPAEQQPLIERMRQATDDRRNEANRLREKRGRKPIGYLENYLFHLWADAPEKVQDYYRSATLSTGRPLTSGTPFVHRRIYASIMDGVQHGLTPKYQNPIDMFMAGLKQYDKYIMAESIFQKMQEAELLRFYRPGAIPDGWEKIDDRFFKVMQYNPEAAGMVERGYWAAPENAARVINRQLAPVSESWEPIVSLVGPGSAIARVNAFKVGFSAYHFINVNNALMAQEQGIGLARLLHGFLTLDKNEIANGARIFARGANPLFSSSLSALNEAFMHGDRMMREFVEPGTQGQQYAEALRAAIIGGMRIKPEQVGTLADVLKNAARDTLHPLVENRTEADIETPPVTRFVKMLAKVPGGVSDVTSAALMHHYIPRIKHGAFLKLAAQELSYYADRGPVPFVLQREILQNVAAHVDSLFGQMVDDNLFMGKTMKTALHLLIGYPSWNIGSARIMLRTAQGVAKTILGRQLDTQQRLALQFAGGLMTSQAIQNALLMRVLTGMWPSTIQDFFQPRDGGHTEYGDPTRIQAPSYMRPYISFGTHPVHWAQNIQNFWIGGVRDLLRNQNAYTGEQIYDPHAPLEKQLEQFGKYIATEVMPFSFTNYARLAETGQGVVRSALGLIGYTPTAAEFTRTKAENYIIAMAGQNVPHQGLTEAEYAARQARIGLAQALREGKPMESSTMSYLKKLSPAIRDQVVKEAVKESRMPRIVGLMSHLTLPQVLHAYQLARDSGDRKNEQYAKIIIADKVQRANVEQLQAAFERLDVEDRAAYEKLLREALGVAEPAKSTTEAVPGA